MEAVVGFPPFSHPAASGGSCKENLRQGEILTNCKKAEKSAFVASNRRLSGRTKSKTMDKKIRNHEFCCVKPRSIPKRFSLNPRIFPFMNTCSRSPGLARSVAARRLFTAIATLPALVVVSSEALAQTWTGTSNGTYNWSSGTNWSATPVSGINTSLSYTSTLPAGTVIVSNNDIATPPFQLNSLSFTNVGPASGTAPTLTLQGSQLEFVTNGSAVDPSLIFNSTGTVRPTIEIQNNLVLTNNLTANTTSNARVSGVISGGGNLTKTGNGVLTLGGSNTYTGTTTVGGTAGGIIVTSNNALGTTAGITTLAAGTSLGLTGGINYSTAEAIIGSGGGSTAITGQFTNTLRGLVQSVSGNNTFAGSIQINATGVTRFGTQDGAQLTLTGPITMSSGVTGVTILFRAGGTNGDFITLSNSGNSWDAETQIFSGNGGTGSGVRLGGNNTLSTSATLYSTGGTGSGTTLDLAGYNQEVGGLANLNGNNVLKIINSDSSKISTLTLNGTVNRVSGGATILSGAGQIQVVKTGAFTQTFNGTNTYTGGTLINQGALSIQSTNSLPGWNTNSSYSVANGATLAVQNLVTDGNITTMLGTTNFQAGSLLGFDTTTANRTYAVVLSNTAQGALGLNKVGTNTLFLTQANSYTGNTTISVGTLQIGDGTDTGSIASTPSITNNSALVFNVGAGNRTVAAVVSGSGSLSQNGSGTITLTGNNSYTGATNVNSGTLRAGSAQAFGAGSTVTLGTASGATLDLNGNNVSIGRLNGGNATAGTVALGTSNLTITNASGTYSGNLTGSGSLLLTGGSQTLAKASAAYTGNVTISSGAVLISQSNTPNVLGTNTGGAQTVTVASGATFNHNNADNAASQPQNFVINGTGAGGRLAALEATGMGFGNAVVRGIAVATDSNIFVNSYGTTGSSVGRGLAPTGALAGAGNLTITGGNNGGFLQLGSAAGSVAGYSAFTGNVNVRSTSSNATLAGGLISNINNALGSTANIDLGNNTYFTVGASQTIGGLSSNASDTIAARVNLGANTLTVGSTNNLNSSFAGVISGTGVLTKAGTGTLTLSGNNTFSGNTSVTSGILNIQNSNALGSTANGTAVAAGATLQLQGGTSYAAETLRLNTGNTGTAVLQNVSGNNTWNGIVNVTGSFTNSHVTRVSSDANTLTLAGDINLGTVNANANSQFVLQGDGKIDVTGKISGIGAVTSGATGTGIRKLSNGTNDYTGNTGVNGGTLQAGVDNVIPYGAGKGNMTFSGSGVFDLNGFDVNVNGLSSTSTTVSVVNNATGTNKTLTVGNNDVTSSYAGVIADNTSGTGTVALTKTGTGSLTLSGNNTYSGGTTVNGGSLFINSSSGAGTGGITVNSGVLKVNAAIGNAITLSGGTLSGNATLAVDLGLSSTASVISPGNSPGISEFTTTQNWTAYTYDWEINNFTGTTAGTDFDNIAITTGGLNLTGGTSYVLNVLSLMGDNTSGIVPNFGENSISWSIISTQAGITAFDAGKWTINSTAFAALNGSTGTFSLILTNADKDLTLVYTPVPEPSAYAAVAGFGALGLALYRRRKTSQKKAA